MGQEPTSAGAAISVYSITSSARARSIGRHIEAKRLGGPQVDDKFKSGRAVDRYVCRSRAVENTTDAASGPPVCVGYAVAVADQAAGRRQRPSR